VEFRILGPLEVVDQSGTLDIPAAKHRTLLATLLLRVNQTVSIEHLTDCIWDDQPPANPRRSVATYVTRLRQALGDDGTMLRSAPGGYRIDLIADRLDLARFNDLMRRAADTAQPQLQIRMLTEALSLWRGDPLGDIASEHLHGTEVPRLVESWVWARERRADVALRLGRHAEVIAELRQLTAEYPLRERFWAQLMLALRQAGRQAEALAAYDTARRSLVDALGVEPGTDLRAAHAAVLAGDAHTGNGLPPGIAPPAGTPPATAPPAGTPPVTVPHQLPPAVASFTGRDDDLARLHALLGEHDGGDQPTPDVAPFVAVVTGTAGVGKTALAVHCAHQVAHRYPDGQLYINVRGYDPRHPIDVSTALDTLLRGLGIAGADIPQDVNVKAGLYRSILHNRRILVLIDNAKSVDQVRLLLPGTPTCLTLVTSRDSLSGLVAREGATRLRLDRLPDAEAGVLLRTLLGPEADASAIVTLTDVCAGLPLALRIAAERVADEPLPTAVADLAAHPLDHLVTGEDPHTALRAVLSWSYAALPADAAEVFRAIGLARRAGLVPGHSWDIGVAAALTGCSFDEARRRLRVLAAAHLVEPRSCKRYGMHDLLTAYAAELADIAIPRDGRRAPIERLLRFYAEATTIDVASVFPDDAEPVTLPDWGHLVDPDVALCWLEIELPNLLSVVQYAADNGWPDHARRIARVVRPYLLGQSRYAEIDTIEKHLAGVRPVACDAE